MKLVGKQIYILDFEIRNSVTYECQHYVQVQENNFVVKIMTINWIPFKTIASEFKYYIRVLQNQTLVTDNDVNISFFLNGKDLFFLK